MSRTREIWLAGLAALFLATPALAEPETDIERQAEMAQRFEPFDSMPGPGWEAAFPTPFIRQVASGKPDSVTVPLKPGAYMVVVLCNCVSMDVSLFGPDRKAMPSLRSSDQASMYSLDVAAPAEYLTGVEMGDCNDRTCDFAVKVYRKKP
jgi:hypothetical protein